MSNRRYRCSQCGHATDNYTPDQLHAGTDSRVCKLCQQQAAGGGGNGGGGGGGGGPSNVTAEAQQQLSPGRMAAPMNLQRVQEESRALRFLYANEPSNQRLSVLRRILAAKTLFPGNRAMKHFDFDYFHSLSAQHQEELLWIVNSGVCNPDSSMGCYAMHWQDYEKFRPFFSKVIADYHKVPIDAKHVTNWSLSGVANLPADGKLDLAALGLPALSMRVRVGRNLTDFPLPGTMTQQDRVKLELKMTEAFKLLVANPKFGGAYHSLTPGHPNQISEAQYQELVHAHLMFKDMSKDDFLVEAGIARHWPYGRGCYTSADRQVIVWVGEEDHLRIMCMKRGTVLNDVFDRLRAVLDTVESLPGLKFATVPGFGYVTSCPTNLGTGMRASVHIPLPNLTRDGTDAKAKAVAKPLGLSVRGLGGEHTPIGKDGTVDLSPSARFCITEGHIVAALYAGIRRLQSEEQKA